MTSDERELMYDKAAAFQTGWMREELLTAFLAAEAEPRLRDKLTFYLVGDNGYKH